MRRRILTAAVVAGLAGLAWAEPAPKPAGSQTDKTAEAPLAGPKVESTEVVEGRSRFGGEANAPGSMRDRPLGIQALERALRSFADESLPAELRLTDDQAAQLRAAVQSHREATRAYMREHREEFAGLRRNAGERGPEDRPAPGGRGDTRRDRERDGAGGPPDDAMGGPPEGMDGPPPRERPGANRAEPTPEQRAARDKLRELMAGAPQVTELQKKIAAVLNEGQRAHLEAQLQLIRTEAQRRAMERLTPAGEAPADQAGLRERMRDMSPEERERVRGQMRERRGADTERRQRERARDEGAPPRPGMDSVEVPDPDGT